MFHEKKKQSSVPAIFRPRIYYLKAIYRIAVLQFTLTSSPSCCFNFLESEKFKLYACAQNYLKL